MDDRRWRRGDRRGLLVSPAMRGPTRRDADPESQLSTTALPWFADFVDLNRVLHVLRSEPEQMETLWGFGRNPSPVRFLMTGYVARALGDEALAEASLQAAAAWGCYPQLNQAKKS